MQLKLSDYQQKPVCDVLALIQVEILYVVAVLRECSHSRITHRLTTFEAQLFEEATTAFGYVFNNNSLQNPIA